ncbi:insulin-like growth factor 3 [Colossoma macropomum]|uniref:insulin-like growth factor 3 n=1 Tax=Colossoma macropomum TaxID=42526 RepID=UPI001863DAD0|nr:insulin-like growth factor 3 [Colossoma macropomum]
MAHTEGHTLCTAGPLIQVLCWRSVCVVCVLLCVAVLPELGDAAKPRCGAELIADLEFVCGERGFYRGRVGGARHGGPRSRGNGIVEQCCVKGCDLQHLEKYCAKPKRRRRQAPTTTQQVREDQFRRVLLREYHRLQHDLQELTHRLKERTLHQDKLRSTSSPRSNEKIHKSAHSEVQRGGTADPLRTFSPHGLRS